MGFVIRIRNLGSGPWKVRFRENTPREIMTKIDALMKPGGRLLIPEIVTPYIDEDHLNRCAELGVVVFQKVSMNRVIPVVPMTKVQAPKPRSLAVKPNKDTDKAGVAASAETETPEKSEPQTKTKTTNKVEPVEKE